MKSVKGVLWCASVAAVLAVWPATAGAETLEVHNTSSATVCFVYVSPCSMTAWGPDVLGDSNTLEPGATAAVNINPGCWDLKAEDCSHAVLATRRLTVSGDASWTLASSTTTATIIPPPDNPPPDTATPHAQLVRDTARITVKNRSGDTVCFVYVSPCSSDQWGDDVLEESVLNNGDNARISVNQGCWDLKAEDCSHAVIATQTGLQVDHDTNWTVGHAAPTTARVTIKNRTGQTICYAFASSCSSDQWGDDILAESVLASGDNAVVVVQRGCWDLRVEDCDHNELATRRNMDIQHDTNWNVR